MKRKEYEDDDGRTIADMSGVEDRSPTGFLMDSLRRRRNRRNDPDSEEEQIDNKTRRSYAFGAVGAGLLIGLIYIVAFAIVIVIMLLIMGVL